MKTNWTQQEAIALCVKIEAICPKFGCHVALTGGCLYGGTRKDLDIIFYRIRQAPRIDDEGLFDALAKLDIFKDGGFGFCVKAVYGERRIDFLFPEELSGEYLTEEGACADAADKLTTDDLLR